MKRAFDVVGAALGLVVAWPVILLLIFLIRRESPGPGVFTQRRVGREGRIFPCRKLRTMFIETPDLPSHQASASQVTPLGRKLRRTKLDELPQLWNVLKGEMSFVGPRPCLPSQMELIEERRKRGVLSIRPGITGLAQINNIDMSDPLKLAEKDAEYVRARSFRRDLLIILQTVVGGAGQGDRIKA